jgi:hypothetical protein
MDQNNGLNICNICNKNYSSYKSLWNHNKKFHNNTIVANINTTKTTNIQHTLNTITEELNKKIHKCKYCGKIYNIQQSKWKHEQTCKTKLESNNNINKLITKVKSLEIEINKLKNKDNKIIKNNGFIYIIHEREFIESNKNIYKLGRTYDTTKRMGNYPKNSSYCFYRQTNNMVDDETKLIKIFKEKFIHKKDIGYEYFEGNINDMIKIINNYLDELNNNQDKINNDISLTIEV